jgi:PTH2 family peptidyl-tRNA hydrolase
MSSSSYFNFSQESISLAETALRGATQEVNNPLRMVFIVRKDLSMSVGKTISQCCHASSSLSILLSKHYPDLYQTWQNQGHTKITLKVDSYNTFSEIQKKVVEKQLPFYLVLDAGKTQIDSGSETVLAIGPATKQQLDGITNQLKMY